MKKVLYLSFAAVIILCKQAHCQSTEALAHTLIIKVEKSGIYENHSYTGYFETKTLKRIVIEKAGFMITVTREQNDELRCVLLKRISDGLSFLDWKADGFLHPVAGWDAYKQSATSTTIYFLTAQNVQQIDNNYRNCINAILESF